ncbi:MAG: RluA family pseudouridine synthase [Bacteroidota bacterium]|nr:RluA family pseudouridine synthase [Bacteroidota bacterium]
MKFKATKNCTLMELLLSYHPGMSNSKARKMIENNTVTCGNRTLIRAIDELKEGQEIELQPKVKERVYNTGGVNVKIVYEDKWLVVVHKPRGIISSGNPMKEGPSLFTYVRAYLRDRYGSTEQLYPVHRLDREVEGLIMFARSPRVKEKLQENWKEVHKYYLALTTTIPEEPEGVIHSWLREESDLRMVSYEYEVARSKEAITHYKVLKTFPPYALLEIKLDTGRKNQIRVHLNSIGCSIVGDRRYGDTSEKPRPVHLLSFKLEFNHPITGHPLSFTLDPPASFTKPMGRKGKI